MNCPICDSTCSPSLTKDGCCYLECSGCELLFYRPDRKDVSESIKRFYDRSYWEMERAEAIRREREDGFIRAIELLYVSGIKVENVLDFGCGPGITVGMLRDKLGLNAAGVDLSADFEETPFLHRCELRDLLDIYPPGHFDAIYSIEVFEHLEDPASVLRQLKSLLRPDGKILINTGTREFLAKHDPELAYIDPLRRGHISIYSLKSLNRLASSIGYAADFLGDRRYEIVLSPAGSKLLFPNTENVERTRLLGDWYPVFLREYMRLVFLEKEFEQKSAWISDLLKELEWLHWERGKLIAEKAKLESRGSQNR